MNSINMTGKLGQKPELKYTNGGKPYVKFSIAVHRFNYNFGGNFCWVNCECYDQAALFLVRAADKGTDIAIVGELQTYTIQKGMHKQECYSVVCKSIEVFDDKRKKYVSDGGISQRLDNIPAEKKLTSVSEDLETDDEIER